MHGSSLAAIWFGHRSWGKQRVRAYFFETTNCMHYDFHIVCHNYVAGRYSLPFMAATTASRTLGTKQIALYRGVAGFVVLNITMILFHFIHVARSLHLLSGFRIIIS